MANRPHNLGPVRRFWEKVKKAAPDECWPWQGATTKKGYGRFTWAPGKQMRSHRVAWALDHNVAPEQLHTLHIDVHHTCETNECCNPGHLEALDSQTHDRLHARELRRRIRST
jgi:hypothetical protein